MIKSRRSLIPVVIFSLVYGLLAFAFDTHFDDASDDDGVCQICLYGAHSNAALPAAGFAPISIFPVGLASNFHASTFIAPHVRLQDPRAPPFVV